MLKIKHKGVLRKDKSNMILKLNKPDIRKFEVWGSGEEFVLPNEHYGGASSRSNYEK